MIKKLNVDNKFSLFNDYWSPKIIADLNDSQVKLAKLKGDFVWHKHDNEDELFFVFSGSLKIELRDQENICLEEGEIVVIPKGIEHRPVAKEEVHVMLIELKGIINTGDVQDDKTRSEEVYI